MPQLKEAVLDALRCHYHEEADIPRIIRLHARSLETNGLISRPLCTQSNTSVPVSAAIFTNMPEGGRL